MRIVVSGWFWGQPSTGSGQYVNRLLPQLISLTAETENASSRYARAQGVDGKVAPKFMLLLPGALAGDAQQFPGSTIIAPPPPMPRKMAKLFWEQVTVPIWARRLQADLLLIPYWAAPLWQPVPTVVTVHDLIPLLLPAYRGGWPGALYTWLVGQSARRSAAVLTVSEAGKRDIIEHLKLSADRVFAVHHGPNDTGLCKSNAGSSAKLASDRGIDLPERYFLYLGGFDARKNVLGIVRAYRRYLDEGGDPAVYLVLAGPLPSFDAEIFPDPQRLVHQLELTDSVRFIGWVDEADKSQLYAGATAFLFPSTYEGFGMMLLEAMAAGAPVITSSE